MPEPQDWQEPHSPTERVDAVTFADGRARRSRVTRRVVDAQLWGNLSTEQQSAAEMINKGFMILTHGLGLKCQSFERRDGGKRGLTEGQAALASIYRKWVRRSMSRGIRYQDIVSVVVMGNSCKAMDRTNRKRDGTCRAELIRGLDLYVDISGC